MKLDPPSSRNTPVDHPLRQALTKEVHARPFMRLVAPVQITHFAMVGAPDEAGRDYEHLLALCAQAKLAPPLRRTNQFTGQFDGFQLRWERHAEFCSWAFFRSGPSAEPFATSALANVPPEWVANLPGSRLVAVHVAFEARRDAPRPAEELDRYFNSDLLAGSRVADGAAEVWTDFHLHDDGFGRILIQDQGLQPRQAGRLAQRLLEIESYRLMALLGLPLAQEAIRKVSEGGEALSSLSTDMQRFNDLEHERATLDRLILLATEIEQLTVTSDVRLGATRAYHALVERRIAELREARIEGLQTIGQFMDRRFAPAMRTCLSAGERIRALGERLARFSDLLRTRVDVARETQNQDLLASMERRGRLQLRLQATVEGLSIAAISYYVLGVLAYAIKAASAAGVRLNVDVVTGLAIPFVVAIVWSMIRGMRRRIMSSEQPLNEKSK